MTCLGPGPLSVSDQSAGGAAAVRLYKGGAN